MNKILFSLSIFVFCASPSFAAFHDLYEGEGQEENKKAALIILSKKYRALSTWFGYPKSRNERIIYEGSLRISVFDMAHYYEQWERFLESAPSPQTIPTIRNRIHTLHGVKGEGEYDSNSYKGLKFSVSKLQPSFKWPGDIYDPKLLKSFIESQKEKYELLLKTYEAIPERHFLKGKEHYQHKLTYYTERLGQVEGKIAERGPVKISSRLGRKTKLTEGLEELEEDSLQLGRRAPVEISHLPCKKKQKSKSDTQEELANNRFFSGLTLFESDMVSGYNPVTQLSEFTRVPQEIPVSSQSLGGGGLATLVKMKSDMDPFSWNDIDIEVGISMPDLELPQDQKAPNTPQDLTSVQEKEFNFYLEAGMTPEEAYQEVKKDSPIE